jgi:methionyl-tRNA synthetase
MGLQPRAVSRDLDWGIPVPVEGAEGKVLYVWFDAPIGYISNTKELLPDSWEKWWKDPETRLLHFIGKDNIVFHCIVFPAMLKAEGSYILPENVPANEFLNLEGDKISTSRNWAVWLHEYLEEFPGKQDVLRYVLTANAPTLVTTPLPRVALNTSCPTLNIYILQKPYHHILLFSDFCLISPPHTS